MSDTIIPVDLAAAVTAVRSAINEATASFWSDAEIQNWIKLGVLNLTTFGQAYEATGSITLVAATMEYSVPTDMKAVVAALYVPAAGSYNALLKIKPEQINSLRVDAVTGPPQYFYHFAGKIGLWPVPTATEAAKTVSCYGYKATDDITLLSDEFQAAAIEYAVAQALWKDRRPAEAAQAWARFISILSALRTDISDAKKVTTAWMDRQVPVGSYMMGKQGNG